MKSLEKVKCHPPHSLLFTNHHLSGKSTLLRLIMNRETANKGYVQLGEHNIIPNYFQQNQAEALNLKLTVLDTLIQVKIDCAQPHSIIVAQSQYYRYPIFI